MPEEISELIRPIIKGKADEVYGSGFLKKNNDMKALHKLGNLIISLVTKLLYHVPVTEVMTGREAFLKKGIVSLNLKEKGLK